MMHQATVRQRWTRPGGLVVALVGIALFGGAFLASSAVTRALRPQPPAAESSSAAYVAEGAVSRTDRGIGALQERLRQNGDDPRGQTALGLAYLQKARETGDPSYDTRAEALLMQALERLPDDADTLIGLGSLALARHDFR